jgi:hypothetical protein
MQGVITLVKGGCPAKQLSTMLSPGAVASAGRSIAPSGPNRSDLESIKRELPPALIMHINESQHAAILATLEGALPFTCIQVHHIQLPRLNSQTSPLRV